MTTTTTKQKDQDLKRAEELMRTLAQINENEKALKATIKNELDAYSKNASEIETELLEIGKRNKSLFNLKGNLEFEAGYLHIIQKGLVVLKSKFDLAIFRKAHPELIKEIKGYEGTPTVLMLLSTLLKSGDVKKAFIDADQRKDLKSFGVDMDTEEGMEVKVSEKKVKREA